MLDVLFRKSRLFYGAVGAISFILISLALLPNLVDVPFPPKISIDTDPENMLETNEPARILHRQLKEKFDLHDVILLAVESSKGSVLNEQTLTNVMEVSKFSGTLQWQEEGGTRGVLEGKIMSLDRTDLIETVGPGIVKLDWALTPEKIASKNWEQLGNSIKEMPYLENILRQ